MAAPDSVTDFKSAAMRACQTIWFGWPEICSMPQSKLRAMFTVDLPGLLGVVVGLTVSLKVLLIVYNPGSTKVCEKISISPTKSNNTT